jgi:beta-glucosidase
VRLGGYIALVLVITLLASCSDAPDAEVQDDSGFVDSLLNQMTLEEKVGQMINISLMALAEGDFWMRRDTVILDTTKMRTLLAKHHVGSVQNLGTYPFSPDEWRQNIGLVQDYVKKNTRLKIPIIYGIDGVHGANYSAGSTLLPQQINIAATWNPELAQQSAEITAYELRASGIPWNYAPVLDVSKQPLWGRIFETFGEDTYMTSQMGEAWVKGAQGDSIVNNYSTAVCLKHFLGYGAAYNGKDRSPVYLPERMLRQSYLPPFEKAIEAGALSVMINSGSVNGIPSHVDHYLITKVLKGELGFEGFTISDWDDITNLVKTHQVAKDEKEAVMLSVNAGLDMCMEPYDASFGEYLIELVEEGSVSMERINDAVRRILKVKYAMGLFDKLQTDPSIYPDYGSAKFAEAAKRAAIESMTLLKNEKARLPLAKTDRILVTGVAGNSINYLNGAWSRTWEGVDTTFNDTEKLTIYEALAEKLGSNRVSFVQGTNYSEELNVGLALQKARTVDQIIVCLGEKPATEKPSDIDELDMPDAQLNLVRALAKAGKPITIVLVEGRPRIIREVEPLADAILMAYLPGNEGGRAIAEVLMGEANPSGKLPYTYPRFSGSIWPYDHTKSDKRDAGFGFDAFNPQYEFGFGLSYTDFEYSNLTLSTDTLRPGGVVRVTVDVKNIGERPGKEVVQLYSSDLVASIVPATKQLRRFEKVLLQPGEGKTLSFELSQDDLKFVDQYNNWVAEEGAFSLQIDTLIKEFYLTEK